MGEWGCGVSYEVYIDVEHHDKHYYGDNPGKESTAYKLTDGPEPLEHVVNALRMFADEIDPRFICSHCGKTRGEHHREGGLYRCFNRMGPITQAKWWYALKYLEWATTSTSGLPDERGEPAPTGYRSCECEDLAYVEADLSLALEALREVRSGFDFPAELGNIVSIDLRSNALTKAHAAWTRARAVLNQLEEGERSQTASTRKDTIE